MKNKTNNIQTIKTKLNNLKKQQIVLIIAIIIWLIGNQIINLTINVTKINEIFNNAQIIDKELAIQQANLTSDFAKLNTAIIISFAIMIIITILTLSNFIYGQQIIKGLKNLKQVFKQFNYSYYAFVILTIGIILVNNFVIIFGIGYLISLILFYINTQKVIKEL